MNCFKKQLSLFLTCVLCLGAIMQYSTNISAADEAENLAYKKPTGASSCRNESDDYLPSNAVDGIKSIGWSSKKEPKHTLEWWKVDLENIVEVDNMMAHWSKEYATEYKIMVALTDDSINNDNNDDSEYTLIHDYKDGMGGARKISMNNIKARYIKIVFIKKIKFINTYTILELEVFGTRTTTNYNVDFELNYEDSPTYSQIAEANEANEYKITAPAEPTRDNHTFEGWYTDATCITAYDFSNKVIGNITLYAKWTVEEITYEVTFELNYDGSGENPTSKTANEKDGYKITAPAEPTRDNHTFEGWYTDATCITAYDFSNKVIGNITLYAKWTVEEITYEVTFELNYDGSGENPTSKTANEKDGYKITAPAEPTRDNHTFEGWYTDATCITAYDFSNKVIGNITLFAKWTVEEIVVEEPSITSISVSKNILPTGGGTVTIAVNGTDLTSGIIKMLDRSALYETIFISSTEVAYIVTLPKNTTNANKVYTFVAYLNDVVTKLTVDVTVSKTSSTGGGSTGGGSTGGGSTGGGSTNETDNPSTVIPPEVIIVDDKVPLGPVDVNKSYYKDVDENHFAFEAINNLTKRGIVNGFGDGYFKPSRYITRAEFSIMIFKAFDFKKSDFTKAFSDVNSKDWYFEPIDTFASIGVLNGFEDGAFKPNENITREQMAFIVYKVINLKNINATPMRTDSLVDSEDISNYAKEAVKVLYQLGLINDLGNGIYAPQDFATRAHAVIVIYNLLRAVDKL